MLLALALVALPLLALILRPNHCKMYSQLLMIQLSALLEFHGSLVNYILFQFEVFRILWNLEQYHRLDVLLGAYTAGLPHVDTAGDTKQMWSTWLQTLSPFHKAPKKLTMMEVASHPIVKDFVMVGGGHSHVFLLKMLGMKPIPGVQITLITRDVDTPYSGMLPGHIAGHYNKAECHIDLGRLAAFCGARLVHAEACGLDLANKKVLICPSSNASNEGIHGCKRPPIPYDVLSINLGSAPSTLQWSKDCPITPVKPIDGFSARWDMVLEQTLASKGVVRLVVVGGGAGGVELTLAMHHRLTTELRKANKDPSKLHISVISRSPTLMPQHNKLVQKKFKAILEERNIQLILGKAAAEVSDTEIVCDDGSKYPYHQCVWCTAAGAQAWLKDTGLKLSGQGFIEVDRNLQTSAENVFAVGDCCHMVHSPRPKAGVFAVRMGPPLMANVRAALLGGDRVPYEPQSVFLGIIGTGDENAIASKGEMAIAGPWLWDLKEWIDRKWMSMYTTNLPDMQDSPPEPSAAARAAGPDALDALSEVTMRCGGCGAKVGASVLSRVMAKLDPPTRDEVLVGLDAPDDCAVVSFDQHQGFASVQTVDFFRSFIKDPFVFGQVAANHSLSDCHAMCAEAQTALAIAVVPYALEDKVEDALYQMMAGACEVLRESNCALVGGHTCEGTELSLGFCVNGIVLPREVLRKAGMAAGQKLILTKAVGTGTLFAAAMRVKAKGSWVETALRGMVQSNRQAGLCLRSHSATSCTDVTGFGVLGHLVEMIRAANEGKKGKNGVGVQLELGSLPVLPGARECLAQDIYSSLQPQNLRLKRAVANEASASLRQEYPLLFDPQTAGGLMGTVPVEAAAKCIEELKSLGYKDAAVIGEVVPLAIGEDDIHGVTKVVTVA